MRIAFAQTLAELAAKDSRIFLLTGDLGYMVLDAFMDRFPTRFLNVGVAEQNMIGIATGLADAGYIPFVYSIGTFASMRAYEFIRNGPILHQLPVRIVGVGHGFEYGPAGITHYALEDVALMRVQPGITVIAPADHLQTRNALLSTWNRPGPIYYSLGKDDKSVIPGLNGAFRLGQVERLLDGTDILFVSCGSIVKEVYKAAVDLEKRGLTSTILVMASIHPAPVNDLITHLKSFSAVFAVESHYSNGGIGSIVAEVIAENGMRCRLIRCAVSAALNERTGSEAYMNDAAGLSSLRLVQTVLTTFSQAQ